MSRSDFVYFNVPGLLRRYANPTEGWQQKILALASTQLELLKKYDLINSSAPALHAPLEEVVVRFSDFTRLGQEFVLSGAIEKWMSSCDRKGTKEAYEDRAPLEKRIVTFVKARKAGN